MTEKPGTDDDLRREYDPEILRRGVRGKYSERYAAMGKSVELAPDVASAFPDDNAVNETLRLVLQFQSWRASLQPAPNVGQFFDDSDVIDT